MSALILDRTGQPMSRAMSQSLSREVAPSTTDPNFYGALEILPNPDEVLRKLGVRDQVFRSILADAHVMGEVRSLRGNLFSYNFDVTPGQSDERGLEAQRLCREAMKRPPMPFTTWDDLIWTAYSAVLHGHTVCETPWQVENTPWLPRMIREIPRRRIRFTPEHELRILSRDSMVNGDAVEPAQALVWRHMPSRDNPYGEALLSRCFWPSVFKRGGFRYFVKFCEKYGIPWAVGKVPNPTDNKVRTRLLGSLRRMIEDAVAVLDDDNSIELIERKAGVNPVQQDLINLCNSEMSKALTSQTQNTEVQDKGSRAVAQSHGERQATTNTADRRMVSAGFDCLWAWITQFNLGPDVMPPRSSWSRERTTAITSVAELRDLNEMIDLSEQWVRKLVKAPKPETDEDTIKRGTLRPQPGAGGDRPAEFARGDAPRGNEIPAPAIDRGVAEMDGDIDQMIEPIAQLVAQYSRDGRTLEDLEAALLDLYPNIDDAALARHLGDAMAAGYLYGMERAR